VAQINRITLAGNLTAAPTLRRLETAKGTVPVVDARLAINRTWTNEAGEKRERRLFLDLTIWGRSAEAFLQRCGKGDNVFVEGELVLDRWTDKETQENRERFRVRVQSWSYLRSPKPHDPEANGDSTHEPDATTDEETPF